MKSLKEISSIKDVPEEELVVGGASLCAGCPADLGLKLALKALGKNTIVVNSSGCMTLFVTYPHMPVKVPWLHLAIETAGAAVGGIRAGLKQLGKKGINVLCYVGDGATYDIGFQSLSGAAERGESFVYVCYNNQSFSNTGVQMASSTPFKTYTTTTPQGNPFGRKPMVKIMAAHGIPYAATACVSHPLDFMKKVQKAARADGSTFIDLLCPCPTGWGFDQSRTIETGKLAVSTGAWPLYEIERGRFSLTLPLQKLEPIESYLKTQRRFHHIRPEEAMQIQNMINMEWELLRQGKFWEAVEY
jgi:pyruvate ferredoxin oxidoreductase beta subunit